MRREFNLSEEETAYVNTLSSNWETIKEAGNRWLLIHDFIIPDGYSVDKATVAINIPFDYPTTKLDMAYFHPEIKRKDGLRINRTETIRTIDDKQFQRWSRHYSPKNPWIPNRDSIITHIMAIQGWLIREFRR